MDQQTLDEATEQQIEVPDPGTAESSEPQEWSVADPEGTNSQPAAQHLAPAADRHADWVAAQKPSQYVVVWTHLLAEPHHWADAHAQVLPNGVLLIHQRNKAVPVKGYAAGAWAEFEHVGDYRPVERPSVDDYNRKRQADKTSMEPHRSDFLVRQEAKDRTLGVAYGAGKLPEPVVDDTQNIPVVHEDTDAPAGGGAGPKAPAGPDESPSATASRAARRSVADLGIPAPLSDLTEEPTVGPLRAFWRSLKIAPPSE